MRHLFQYIKRALRGLHPPPHHQRPQCSKDEVAKIIVPQRRITGRRQRRDDHLGQRLEPARKCRVKAFGNPLNPRFQFKIVQARHDRLLKRQAVKPWVRRRHQPGQKPHSLSVKQLIGQRKPFGHQKVALMPPPSSRMFCPTMNPA